MAFKKVLKASKQTKFKKELVGFDIETHTEQQIFLCGSFVSNDNDYFSYLKLENKEFIRYQKNKVIVATNLSFDFNGLMGNDAYYFDVMYRGSDLLTAKTYLYKGNFLHPKERSMLIKKTKTTKERKEILNNAKLIKFVDTMAYTPKSVESLGNIIKINKLKHPRTFTEVPKLKEDIEYTKIYNIQDATISKKFLEFFFNGLQDLGASIKLTIGSCAMSIFRNKYLTEKYYRADTEMLNKMFNALYGGRTECFVRGKLTEMFDHSFNFYDINCYSDDTEILTEKGFKKYSQVKVNDVVYSMKNEKLVKNKIEKMTIRHYNGAMIRLQNENTDQLVTPNHRVYYKDYNRAKFHKDNKTYGWSKDWKVKQAKDLAKVYINLPNAKEYDGKIHIDENRLKLCAWFITEGHLNKNNIVEISQSFSHNKKHCLEILNILNSLGIKYRRRDRIQKDKKYLYVYFNYDEIINIMKNKYYNSYEMRLPHNFMEYDLISKRILFEELLKGDGSQQKGKTTYVSYSDLLLTDF